MRGFFFIVLLARAVVFIFLGNIKRAAPTLHERYLFCQDIYSLINAHSLHPQIFLYTKNNFGNKNIKTYICSAIKRKRYAYTYGKDSKRVYRLTLR